jgi:hypothetical protein
MNSVGSINVSHFLVTIISLASFFFICSIIPIEALNKQGTLLKDYDNLKKIVDDIKNGNLIDDKITLNELKDSGAYQGADKNMQDCINLAAKIGHSLKGTEIVHCFEDANYFKDKYPNVSVPENKIPQRESGGQQNVTQANLTQKIPEPETEVMRSVPQTNATLTPQTNATLTPQTNATLTPQTNATLTPQTNATLTPQTNASQISKGKISINVTVAKDPITPGESQVVTAVASDPVTGKILDHVLMKLTLKDPIGIILKNYTTTEGNVTRSFKIGYNAIGKFTILATASQAGVESKKSLPFHVQ